MAKLPVYVVWRLVMMLICSMACLGLNAQGQTRMLYKISKTDSGVLNQLRTVFPNRILAAEYLNKLPAILQGKGYLGASIDSSRIIGDTILVSLFAGDLYSEAGIRFNQAYLPALKNELKSLARPGPFNFSEYRLLQEALLNYYENNGYPFARVSLDSIAIDQRLITAVVAVDKGLQYKVDSVRLFGTAKISRNYIHRYLGIERGSLYQRGKLERIDQRLLELPFLQQQQAWDITMLSTSSLINLYLQPKKSNQVNLLAGFLPTNDQTGGKLLFTIDANLQLKNAFGNGENVGIVWQQIQPKSPRLNLQFQQPFVFNSPFGVDLLFDLYKRDSAYLNINAQAGLMYALSYNQTAKLLIQNQRTNLLEIDTNRIKAFKTLPDIIDVSSLNLGAEYELAGTDYRFNPRKGNEVKLFLSAGNKRIRKNNAITQLKEANFNYNGLYDSLQLNTYQLRIKMVAARYFPVGKQAVLKTAANIGWYESANYFRNELFQIGGFKLLRGFDEEAIFSSRYFVGTIEYRYLFGQNSYFYGFTDFGSAKDASIKAQSARGYFGAGLGIAFESKGGLFNVSFAAGKRSDLDFNIRQSKIHIGYVSIF